MSEHEPPQEESSYSLRQYLLVRHRHNWELLLKFCVVGGTGFVVNLIVFELLDTQVNMSKILIGIIGTEYNIRMYHLISTTAFLIANISNYMLNRWFTFRSQGSTSWKNEYLPFAVIGVASQVVVLALLTLQLNENSPFYLSAASANHRHLTAQAIAIILVTPLSFVGNKIWTFRAVRSHHKLSSKNELSNKNDTA